MTDNYFEILGLEFPAAPQEVYQAYLDCEHPDRRLAYKVLSDPLFQATYNKYPSFAQLEQAGFFDDRVPASNTGQGYILDLPLTPVDKINRNYSQTPVVLLSTGCFSPPHLGHLHMMEQAKDFLDGQGFEVIGGYISASHDDYLITKDQGKAYLPYFERFTLIQTLVEQTDWLMMDPWEAGWVEAPLNFSDVYLRLQSYLSKWVDPQIQVAYVCGGDNAYFSRAFVDQGMCVCVARQGSDFEETKDDPHLDPARIFFINSNKSLEYSSSKIRQGKLDQLENIQESHIQNRQSLVGDYCMRDDLKWATQNWSGVSFSRDQFRDGLLDLFKEAFKEHDVKIRILDLEHQQKIVDQLEGELVILDPCTYKMNSHKLQVSRVFNLASDQRQPLKLEARPGFHDLDTQFMNIPAGKYTLVDDDVASGWTLEKLRKMSDQVEFENVVSLLQACGYNQVADVVDMRDFLLGAKQSGLLLQIPIREDKSVFSRSIYALPYVDLNSRAKIPLDKIHWFSQAVWRLNCNFFKDSNLKLEDACPSTQDLYRWLGFDSQSLLFEIAQWHLQRLTKTYIPAHKLSKS